jgi:GNAT superfamily N-acetyltransferase
VVPPPLPRFAPTREDPSGAQAAGLQVRSQGSFGGSADGALRVTIPHAGRRDGRCTFTAMAVQVRPYRELQPDEIGEWARLVRKAHPPGEVRLGSDLRWADLDAETDDLIQFREDDVLRACAWVTRRTVTISDQEMCVAGIRGVVTDPDYRRRGYGRAVMQRAHELMRSFPDCELALLFSSVMAVPFYENLGWRMVRESVTCEQPGGRIDYTEALPTAPVMAFALRQPADLPSGPVHVHGLPW